MERQPTANSGIGAAECGHGLGHQPPNFEQPLAKLATKKAATVERCHSQQRAMIAAFGGAAAIGPSKIA